MKSILITTLMIFATPAVFAESYYYLNCTAAKNSPEMAPVFEQLKKGDVSELQAGMNKESFVEIMVLAAGAKVYFANTEKGVLVLAEKNQFDADTDPDKGYSFAYGCSFAWMYEAAWGYAALTEIIDTAFKLKDTDELVEFKVEQ